MDFYLIVIGRGGYVAAIDPYFGARPLKRLIQHEVLNELSKEILAGNIPEGSTFRLDFFTEKGIVFRKDS